MWQMVAGLLLLSENDLETDEYDESLRHVRRELLS